MLSLFSWHPKKVGRVFRPRFTNVLADGTLANWMWLNLGCLARWVVWISELPLGQELMSELASTATTMSSLRAGWMSGSNGTFWFASPPSTRSMKSSLANSLLSPS